MTATRRNVARLMEMSGLNRLLRSRIGDDILVVAMHGAVADGQEAAMDLEGKFVLEADFIRQLDYLRRHYRPVSLAQFEAAVRGGPSLPKRAVLVTIDDGYENCLTRMAPHLEARGIPAVLFVTTGLIGTESTLWTNRLEIFWHDRNRAGNPPQLPRNAPPTMASMKAHLKRLPENQRDASLARWIGNASARLPSGHPFRMLDWDQVRRLESMGVTMAAHTVTHPILARESDERVRDEMSGSRTRLEAELGRPVTAFSYPNGGRGSLQARDREMAAACGFHVAFTSYRGRHQPGMDPLMIRRIPIGREEGFVDLFAARLVFPYPLKDQLAAIAGPLWKVVRRGMTTSKSKPLVSSIASGSRQNSEA